MGIIGRFQEKLNFNVLCIHYAVAIGIILSSLVFSVQAATATIVAVIDSGVDDTHSDLAGRLVGGYDFTGGNNPFLDTVGHGTAMASIVAANRATPRLYSKCRLMSLKVTDSLEVPVDRLARAINYAVTKGVEVIYIGAGSHTGSIALRYAVERAAKYGITVVAPAGSQGLLHPLYPAAYESVVSVMGVSWTEHVLQSNHGATKTVLAPGSRIVAAKPGGGYHQVSGSSPAGAWVAGLMGNWRSESGVQRVVPVPLSDGKVLLHQPNPSKMMAKLQYADSVDEDFVVDAPWRTIRDYLPVLFFTPEFSKNNSTIKSLQIFNYDPGTKETIHLFQDDLNGADLLGCVGSAGEVPVQIIGPDGKSRKPASSGEEIGDFWHYIVRVPVECIGFGEDQGKKGEHFLIGRILWERDHIVKKPGTPGGPGGGLIPGSEIKKIEHEYFKVLRVIVDDDPLPKFHPRDHHYDIHVHTIAEQATGKLTSVDTARRHFGGPIAMLLESAFALGLVDIQLKDGNWTDFRGRVATTDHNVFFSHGKFDRGTAPSFGPTRLTETPGQSGEFQWYRDRFGELAGEELTLESSDESAEQFTGSHFLAYGSPHFEGPWHGGGFEAELKIPLVPDGIVGGLLGSIVGGALGGFTGSVVGGALGVSGGEVTIDTGVDNPNDITQVLSVMGTTNGFGYAAHPFSESSAWSPDIFERAIGLPPHNDDRAGSPILQSNGRDFVFKGSQVWNEKNNQVSTGQLDGGKLEVSDLDSLDPFTPRDSPQIFQDNLKWDDGLIVHLNKYFSQLKAGLNYTLKSRQFHRFIRKLYMSAGTDAHGSFNYQISHGSTAEAEFKEKFVDPNLVKVTNNAFGRVRTYTLTSEKVREDGGFVDPFAIVAPSPDNVGLAPISGGGGPRPPREAVMAYREGNTILTDGPIGKFSVDGNCRFDSAPSKLLWHDTLCRWENHNGGIGGRGNFDSGRTALVGSKSPDIIINSIWNGRNDYFPVADGQPEDIQFTIRQVKAFGDPVVLLPSLTAGSRGKFQTALLTGFEDVGSGLFPSALILSGKMGSAERRAMFITNPVWVVPVKIDIKAPENCPIPAGELKVTVDFGISMLPTIPKTEGTFTISPDDNTASSATRIFVKPLDGNGRSTDSFQELTANRKWSDVVFGEFSKISDARFEASNLNIIPCASGGWDAKHHVKTFQRASYAVVITNLRDMHNNPLNAVAKTFVTNKFPPGVFETPPRDTVLSNDDEKPPIGVIGSPPRDDEKPPIGVFGPPPNDAGVSQ